MSNLRDHLTYPDLAGKRKLRRYVFAALLLSVLVLALFGWAQFQRSQARAEVFATPHPVSEIEVQPVVRSSPTATLDPTPMSGCPENPEAWTFLDVFPRDNYKRIEPPCVYEGLAETVAWHMLEFMGYSKPEAAALLELEDGNGVSAGDAVSAGNSVSALPWRPIDEITGLTNTRGPVQLLLTRDWPPHPDYQQWTIDAEGQPGVVYSLRGCYRARAITGNQVESWGAYPVICVVALDRTSGWVVHVLGVRMGTSDHHFTVDMTGQAPLRRFLLFGYTGTGWVLLGEHQDQQVFLEEAGDISQEREQVTERYGAVPWDAEWLSATFGLTMRPLPEGWQTFGADPNAIQAIAEALEQAGGTP